LTHRKRANDIHSIRPLSARASKMKTNNKTPLEAMLAIAVIAILATTASVAAQSVDPTDAGKAVFKRANCFGCHKWHGNGGGGYGGDALSLRKTELTKDQIVETVECGRPGTGMPFFMRGAYDTTKCYDMDRQQIGARIPPEANVFLRHEDVEAVADYVLTHIKGKGEPTYSECTDFFANTSHVCDIYKTAQPSGTQTSTGQPK
jgi:mono/diheme cytochrome c family protein